MTHTAFVQFRCKILHEIEDPDQSIRALNYGIQVLSGKEPQDIYVPVPCLVIMKHGIQCKQSLCFRACREYLQNK